MVEAQRPTPPRSPRSPPATRATADAAHLAHPGRCLERECCPRQPRRPVAAGLRFRHVACLRGRCGPVVATRTPGRRAGRGCWHRAAHRAGRGCRAGGVRSGRRTRARRRPLPRRPALSATTGPARVDRLRCCRRLRCCATSTCSGWSESRRCCCRSPLCPHYPVGPDCMCRTTRPTGRKHSRRSAAASSRGPSSPTAHRCGTDAARCSTRCRGTSRSPRSSPTN